MEDLSLRTLAERLKTTRKAKKRTQDEVAKAIGVNKYTVSDWERGLKQPGFLNILNYCHFL
jgi:transcriptional regulator with XRE-family HTH domain